MLKIFQIERRSQIKDIFAQFDSTTASWIVSDLRTKFEIQQSVLEQNSYFVDNSVLRASDFWKVLLKRTHPEFKIISRDFARTLLRSLLDEETSKFGINSSSEKTVMTYMDQLHPFFFHPSGKETLNHWFAENQQAAEHWQEWAIIAKKCMEIFVKSQLLISNWIPGFLLEVEQIEKYWDRPLWIDLGSEITKSEMDLFLALAKTVDIYLIEPLPEWRKEHSYLLKPYEDIRGHAGKNIYKVKPESGISKKIEVLRFSGMLAEIRHAVVQTRKWLEQNTSAQNIAIVAPDIENYWPVLKAFLDQEGITVNKSEMTKLSSLVTVNKWLASLRTTAKSLSSADLELSFYGRQEYEQIKYEKFKSLFAHLYSEQDLTRHPTIEKIYLKNLKFEKRMSRDDFVGAILFLWDARQDVAPAIQACREVLQNAAADIEMDLNEWLHYLESIVANKEITIEPGIEEGIVVTKLMSAHSGQLTHRIFMGLSEENLRSIHRGGIPGKDLWSLSAGTGFNPENPDQNCTEFELRWIAESRSEHDVFTVGMTDLTGSLQTPAAFWFSMNRSFSSNHKTEAEDPGYTRWDLIQRSELAQTLLNIRQVSNISLAKVEKRVAIDLGEIVDKSLVLPEIPVLSPSAIEKYQNCPFQYTAAALFKLQSFPELDLDIDARTRGSLAHAIFQKITEMHPFRTDWTDLEIENLIEEIRKSDEYIFADEKLWLPFKTRYLKLVKRFIEIERQWRLQFPRTQTVGSEVSWQVELEDLQLKLRGRIDRVDSDGDGRLVVLDYKSSAAGIDNYKKWIDERSLQLLFYIWALEKNGVPELKGEVIGAFYYVFKNLKREKGFQLEEAAGILYPAMQGKGPSAQLEDKEKLIIELESLLKKMSADMKAGLFSPAPLNKEICQRCEWRSLCRAPHLN